MGLSKNVAAQGVFGPALDQIDYVGLWLGQDQTHSLGMGWGKNFAAQMKCHFGQRPNPFLTTNVLLLPYRAIMISPPGR